jgi:hypothetical protein
MGTYSQLLKTKASSAPPIQEQKKKKPKKKATKQTSLQPSKLASNIAILQFDEDDLESLREGAYKAQTFRLSSREVEWLKDVSYRLSKEVKRGKVAQVDILRVSLKLFENLLSMDKATLLKILQAIR